MAQGILEQKRFSPEINPSARAAVDSLRAGRHHAWLRARLLAFRRSVINPIADFRQRLILLARPVGYRLWRAACVAKTCSAVAAENTGAALSSLAGGIRTRTQTMHFPKTRRLQAALALTALAVVVFTYGFYGTGLEVFIDGESMGYVNNQREFDRAVAEVSEKAAELLQRPFELNLNATFRYSLISRSQVFNDDQVKNLLFVRIPELKILDVLSINGSTVAGVEELGVIWEHLNSILTESTSDGDMNATFVEEVSVSRQLAPASIEILPEEINDLLTSNILPAFYTSPEAGTSLADIARSYGLTEEALLERNPHISPDGILDQNLLINYAMPMLQVQLTREEIYAETIPYEILYVDDDTIYTGQTRVDVEGVNGSNTVTANVSYVEGREFAREILDIEHTLEPITEVVAVGTLIPPTYIRPTTGAVSSRYGWRTLFGRREMHRGVDFSGKSGSPIVASSDGVVKFSGRSGNYGLMVVIDHGKGISTLYAHNSKNLVVVGQKVKQGDRIALMGNTGRTTGTHVHFEVQVNGKAVNPFDGYIK
jgi:murein DD-endopeptidase MepM/ murein hydrolase activator NlpD